MPFPSIRLAADSAAHTAQRFPLVLGTAFVAAFASIVASTSGSHPLYTRLLLTALLGLPLLFSLTVLAEQQPKPAPARALIPLAGLGVLGAFWWLWPGWTSPTQVLRYAQLSVAFHLLVAFSPYVRSTRPNGFWQYNRILFLRFLTAWLYSVVLYAGLSIALLAVNKLFGVPVPTESYWRLWIVISFAFHPWFFLAGIPENLAALEEWTDYPTGLRVFTQYVLVPIVALYLAILTLYLAKVLVTHEWPKGWIGYLVSSVAAVGILSWLLVFPLEEREEYAWVKTFTRGFYLVLTPSIVMLWFAIYQRVSQYGITERRYFLIVLSMWLAAVALFYSLTRSRNIKVIPASLCALALITFAGPTGAYSVSRKSQVNRLHALLVRDALLENGKLHRSTQDVPFSERQEISSTLHYILETHGANAIAPWLPDSVKKAISPVATNGYAAETDAKTVMESIDLAYVPQGATAATTAYFSIASDPQRGGIAIDGYAYALNVPYWNGNDSLRIAEGIVVRMSRDSTALSILQNGKEVLAIPLQPVVDSAHAYQKSHPNTLTPRDVMRIEAQMGGAAALAYFSSLSGQTRADGAHIAYLAGEIFLRLK